MCSDSAPVDVPRDDSVCRLPIEPYTNIYMYIESDVSFHKRKKARSIADDVDRRAGVVRIDVIGDHVHQPLTRLQPLPPDVRGEHHVL